MLNRKHASLGITLGATAMIGGLSLASPAHAATVTFYDGGAVASGSGTATRYETSITTSAHSNAIIVVGVGWGDGGDHEPLSNVTLGGTAVGGTAGDTQIGGDTERGHSYTAWTDTLHNVSSGTQTLSFDATGGDPSVGVGVWVLEGFLAGDTANAWFFYDDQTGDDLADTLAFNPGDAPNGTPRLSGDTTFNFSSGEYVIGTNYIRASNNETITGAYKNLRTNNSAIDEGDVLFADGFADSDSQETGFVVGDGYLRAGASGVSFAVVPEPASLALLGLGALALLPRRRHHA